MISSFKKAFFIAFNILCIITLRADFYAHTVEDITVPQNFIWGSALSEYQVSGRHCCTNSNWSDWENGLKEKSDDACQFWDRYKDDVKIMQELGIKSLRFSIEWCLIEPEEGKFNLEAMQHYKDLCQSLLDADIIPMVTLHHFVHPAWFEKRGGFVSSKNIAYFERFCSYVFEHLSDKVHLWCTINEPTIFAFQGYVRGVFPPGKKNLSTAWRVLRNLMQAHTQVYYRLKKMENGDKAQIGLVHQYLKFQSYTSWNPLEKIPGLLFNNLLNDSVIRFLKKGKFNGWFGNKYKAAKREKITDFIGLN